MGMWGCAARELGVYDGSGGGVRWRCKTGEVYDGVDWRWTRSAEEGRGCTTGRDERETP